MSTDISREAAEALRPFFDDSMIPTIEKAIAGAIDRATAALREENAEDKPIPEDAAIEAAHPVNSGSHDTYGEAMRLVGAKHSKAALVELVNWLLMERDELRAECERLRQQLNSANQQHQLKAI